MHTDPVTRAEAVLNFFQRDRSPGVKRELLVRQRSREITHCFGKENLKI